MRGSLQEFMNKAALDALEKAARQLEMIDFDIGPDVAARIVREQMEQYKEKDDDQTGIPT